jgi:hypothetical protein
MNALIVAGMWHALCQAVVLFQPHRRHITDRRPEGTAVGEVDQVEGGTDTASLFSSTAVISRAAAVRVLLQCQPINGCMWSVNCVRSMRRDKGP